MSKKNTKTTTSGDQPALKIGSRVRCRGAPGSVSYKGGRKMIRCG